MINKISATKIGIELIYLSFLNITINGNNYFKTYFSEDCRSLLLFSSVIYALFKSFEIIKYQNSEERFSIISYIKSRMNIWGVKFFFTPLMFQFSIQNFLSVKQQLLNLNFQTIPFVYIFNSQFFPIIVSLFYFIDTSVFSFSYTFDLKLLKNEVRYVDTTFLGVMSCLICYPPLNQTIASIIPWEHSEYHFFYTNEITFVIRLLTIILLFIYVGSSVSLGLKCSNLTHRGVVSNGFYKYIRHPAYSSKVAMWWLISIPFMFQSLLIVFNALFWTFIYVIRAYTEEKNLNKDGEYSKYKLEVKYRFIPFLF